MSPVVEDQSRYTEHRHLWLITSMAFGISFTFGLWSGGHRFQWIAGEEIDVAWHRWKTDRKLHDVYKWVSHMSAVSKFDYIEYCRAVISKVVLESASLNVNIGDLRRAAVEFEENESYMESIALHHVTLSVIRNSTSLNRKTKNEEILQTLFLAQQSLATLIYRIRIRENKRRLCAVNQWVFFIKDVISFHVDDHNGDSVIAEAWHDLSVAIAFAEFREWQNVLIYSLNVIRLCSEYGKTDGPERFEVYGWSLLVFEVARYRKIHLPVDGGVGQALQALQQSTDRLSIVDFETTMFRLFPYSLEAMLPTICPLSNH